MSLFIKHLNKLDNMKLHQQFMLIVVALFTLSSCGKQSTTLEKAPIEVKVKTVQSSDVSARQSFSGTVEEENGSALSFPIAGTVKSVAVTEGQKVHAGQLIAVLDGASFQSSYNMAKATLDQATDAYNRMKILHDNNSLPDVQWVDAESKLKQAESAFEIARKNLNDTKLYAPFSGYISEKNIEVGNNVMPGSPAVKLVTVDNVKVAISVPETEVNRIKLGDNIEISVPALGNRTFTGKIKEKGVSANSISRSYQVKAEINNPGNALLPGMLCTLYVGNGEQSAPAVLVSRHVVQLSSDNHDFVWLNRDGKAAKQEITLGDFVGDRVIVTSGLNDGDQVVVEGQQKISDNMSLKVIK
jgi:RND family efflux transporter MFP subunit